MKANTMLPNGAIIKLNLITENGVIILALRDHPMHKFITWHYDGIDLQSTCHGHYFETYEEASIDFIKRVLILNNHIRN